MSCKNYANHLEETPTDLIVYIFSFMTLPLLRKCIIVSKFVSTTINKYIQSNAYQHHQMPSEEVLEGFKPYSELIRRVCFHKAKESSCLRFVDTSWDAIQVPRVTYDLYEVLRIADRAHSAVSFTYKSTSLEDTDWEFAGSVAAACGPGTILADKEFYHECFVTGGPDELGLIQNVLFDMFGSNFLGVTLDPMQHIDIKMEEIVNMKFAQSVGSDKILWSLGQLIPWNMRRNQSYMIHRWRVLREKTSEILTATNRQPFGTKLWENEESGHGDTINVKSLGSNQVIPLSVSYGINHAFIRSVNKNYYDLRCALQTIKCYAKQQQYAQVEDFYHGPGIELISYLVKQASTWRITP